MSLHYRAFKWIGRKLHLPQHLDIIYWQRLAQSQNHLLFYSYKNDKVALTNQICTKLKSIRGLNYDPLEMVNEYIKDTQSFKITSQNHYLKTEPNNFNKSKPRNRRRKKTEMFNNPNIKKERCKYCKDPAIICRNLAHR